MLAIATNECILVISFYLYTSHRAEPLMIVGFTLSLFEALLTSGLTLKALYMFVKIAKTLEPAFSLQRWPVLVQSSLHLVWMVFYIFSFVF